MLILVLSFPFLYYIILQLNSSSDPSTQVSSKLDEVKLHCALKPLQRPTLENLKKPKFYISGIFPYGPTNQVQSVFELLQIAKYFNLTTFVPNFFPHFKDINYQNYTIDPNLLINIKLLQEHQPLTFNSQDFLSTCFINNTIYITSQVPLVKNLERIQFMNRYLGKNFVPTSIDKTNYTFEEIINNSTLVKDTIGKFCVYLIFPFNVIPLYW